MRTLTKTALTAVSTAALLVSTAADARSTWGHRDRDNIDAGDVIAGALIIGGIAAIASASSNGSRYDDGRNYRGDGYRERGYRGDGYRDRGYDDDYGYNRGGYGSRTAVDQCVRAAQRQAGRYGWARVTDVTQINRVRGGYEVRGRLVVEQRGYNGGYRGGDRYGNRYDRYNDGYDKGRFSCVARYGGVEYVNLSGLRGGY
jgi:hypothetical protein